MTLLRRAIKRMLKNTIIGMVAIGICVAVLDVFGFSVHGAETELFLIGGIGGLIIGEYRNEHSYFNM